MADICQSTALSPTSFVLEPEEIKKIEKDAREHGGSAIVYRGFYDKQVVAIKDFRLYKKTAHRIKKVGWFGVILP
jgi:hypothetical protein